MVFEFDYVPPEPASSIEMVDLPEVDGAVEIAYGMKMATGKIVSVSEPEIGAPALFQLMIYSDSEELARYIVDRGEVAVRLVKDRDGEHAQS